MNYIGPTLHSLDPKINNVIEEILSTYGDKVRLKNKSLLKFGEALNLGTTQATIWQRGGNETYVSTNIIDTLSSSSVSDTMKECRFQNCRYSVNDQC